jgi:hypothetical protein
MSLQPANNKVHDIDEFAPVQQYQENRHLTMPKQQHIENWLDGSEFEPSCKWVLFDIFLQKIYFSESSKSK